MNKSYSQILMYVFLAFVFLFAACVNEHHMISPLNSINESSSTPVLPTDDGKIGNTDIQPDDDINYSVYLRKIWIAEENDNLETAFEPLSFFLKKIESGIIEGEVSIASPAYPHFYWYRWDDNDSIELIGTIYDNVAECLFYDKYGNQGNMTLVFKNNEKIEISLEYTYVTPNHIVANYNGNYDFRPYNISDIEHADPSQTHILEGVDLDSWGTVNIVRVLNRGNRFYYSYFITDENLDIFYKFGEMYPNNIEFDFGVTVEDKNGDGLKDVHIWIAPGQIDYTEYIFYQMEDGLFYSSLLIDQGQ